MMQPQVFPENLHPARKAITQSSISRYNAVARSVFDSDKSPNVVTW
jgi:hypothetical protein